MFQTGQTFNAPLRYSQADVAAFAQVTGDNNAIHLDAEYAATTVFKRPVIHGMLGATIFSKIFGTQWPGQGTIYLKQSLAFKAPMLVDTDYEARCEVLSVNAERHRATVSTTIVDVSTGTVVLSGEAEILNPTEIG
jgi:acyl dehydratase